MDQFNQTNNLQQAIDEVAGSKEEKNDQFGVPPMPATEGEGVPAPFGESTTEAGPSAEQILSGGVTPEAAPASDAAAPAAEAAPVAPGAPAMPEVAPAAETSAAPTIQPAEVPAAPVETAPAEANIAPANGDLASIRENVIKDLLPLMDKVDSSPEEKFEIYKDAMKTMHDASTIGGAYRTATQFSDESKKADALMDLMKTIDNA